MRAELIIRLFFIGGKMKKFLLFIALSLFALTASAQYRHWGHPIHYYGGHVHRDWVSPLLIGGLIGYEINRANNTVIVQQPNVIVEQQPTTMECGPWKEIQTPDGKIYKERTCYQK